MSANPRVVIHLLTLKCGSPLEAVPSRDEMKLAEIIVSILQDFELRQLEIGDVEKLEVVEEEDHEFRPEEDCAGVTTPLASEGTITFSGGQIVSEEKAWAAAEYHWSGTVKQSRSRESTSHCFRFLRNNRDWAKLKSFYEEGLVKRSRRQRLLEVANALKEMVSAKINEGVPLHDRDFKRFALMINRSSPDPVRGFCASDSWLNHFKRHAGLTTRRVTKFVQRKAFLDQEKINDAAQKFVVEIRHEMNAHPLNCFVNIDQSGINKEITVPRCLSFKGEKKTVRVVQSSSAVTHSLTVMPLLFASGKLGSVLFVQLQELGGIFPQRGIFETRNLYVVPGSSHIMTTKTMLSFFEHVFFPQVPDNCKLLLDSWSGFATHAEIRSLIPPGKSLDIRTIPSGATSQVQPADVGFFSYMKSLMKRFHAHVIVHDLPFDLQKRDNILKVVSLVYRLLCHPRLERLIEFAWYKAGYLTTHPGCFENPSGMAFPEDLGPCDESGCEETVAFIRCPYCDRSYCFMHFVPVYHWC